MEGRKELLFNGYPAMTYPPGVIRESFPSEAASKLGPEGSRIGVSLLGAPAGPFFLTLHSLYLCVYRSGYPWVSMSFFRKLM